MVPRVAEIYGVESPPATIAIFCLVNVVTVSLFNCSFFFDFFMVKRFGIGCLFFRQQLNGIIVRNNCDKCIAGFKFLEVQLHDAGVKLVER
jgi:hypothetical protein